MIYRVVAAGAAAAIQITGIAIVQGGGAVLAVARVVSQIYRRVVLVA